MANYCCRPSAGTAPANGSDWTHALAFSTAVASSTYRGHTLYISGESYAAGIDWDATEVGTSRITVRKATADDHVTDTGWSAAWGTAQAVMSGPQNINTGYYTITGVDGTEDDDDSYGISVVNDSASADTKCLYIDGGHHLQFSYLDLDGGGCNIGNRRVDIIYGNPAGASVTVDHCYIHDANRTCVLIVNPTDWIFERNWICRNQNDSGIHGELASIRTTSLRTTWRYNHIFDCDSTGGLVYLDGTHTSAFIYGNLFYHVDPSFVSDRWVSTSSAEDTAIGWRVHHNTFANANGSAALFNLEPGNGSDNLVYNNLFYNNVNQTYTGDWTHDYNWYYPSTGTGGDNGESNGQVGSGDPFEDEANNDFHLTAHTTAGTSLDSTYGTDMDGNPRSTWDRGAYEFGAGVPPTGVPILSVR